MKREEIAEKFETMQFKYTDLVWYARCPLGTHKDIPSADTHAQSIRSLYPDECAKLAGEHGSWEHGFNSGCLAAFRYALGLMGDKDEQEMAVRDFPFLDT
jgi:hypothetical protein